MTHRKYTRDEAVDAIRELDAAAGAARSLRFYCTLGRVVDGLEGGYGTKHIDALADALKSHEVKGLDGSTLRKAGKFVTTLTGEQVRTLCRRGVSWRTAARLSSTNLSDARRAAFVDRVADGRIEPRDLGAAIEAKLDDAAFARPASVNAAAGQAADGIERLAAVLRNEVATAEARGAAADALRDLLRRLQEIVP